MTGLKKVGIILLIFLGPGAMIWFIAKTLENHFVRLPYIGTEYIKDTEGKVIDSTLFTVPDFSLTSFDGKEINRDSIRGKFIILTTLQNECPNMQECGMGVYIFNSILFEKLVKNQDNYHNVKVLSILTDQDGNPVEKPEQKLLDNMESYNKDIWWMTTGDPTPFYSFEYYGDVFNKYPATIEEGEIGTKAFVNSLVLLDDKGHVRGVSGAKTDTDIRNFFDMLKLLKKEEFDANRKKNNRTK